MRKLILYCNQLSELASSLLFDNLKELTDLDLSCNHLTKIDVNTFASLKMLERLDLGFNQLECIDVDLFSQLTNLSLLDLNGNKLNEFDKKNMVNQKFVKKFLN